jgi:hypothetical protein
MKIFVEVIIQFKLNNLTKKFALTHPLNPLIEV